MVAVVLFILIALFRHSAFRCPYRELFFSHKPTYQDSTGLVVSAGCTRAGTLSQAKIYRPECSAQVALYSEKRHFCTFAVQYLASQPLYRLEVTGM